MEYAGLAKVELTPWAGIALQGYGARLKPCEGAHDSLWARALWISDGKNDALVISADLVAVPYDLANRVKARLGVSCGLASEAIMIACAHTHSGPATLPAPYIGDPNPAYLVQLENWLVEAGERAKADVAPVSVRTGRSQAAIAHNRRGARLEGGPTHTDPELITLQLLGRDGAPRGIVFNLACHAVTLGPGNLLASRDWPGYAVDALEAEAPGAMGLFINGANADLNPREVGSFEIAEKLGLEAARAALASLTSGDVVEPGPVTAWARDLPLASRELLTLEELEAFEEGHKASLAAAEQAGDELGVHFAKAYLYWASLMRPLIEAGLRAVRQEGSLAQVITVGEQIAFAAFPGETLNALGVEVKRCSPFSTTLIASNANSYIGYLPPEEEWALGGYEVEDAHRWCGLPGVAQGAPELVSAALIRRLNLVAQQLSFA